MANYNTFVAVDTKHCNILLVTSSARKAEALIRPGVRVDVWNNNERVRRIVSTGKKAMKEYIDAEREYIRMKQKKVEARRRYGFNAARLIFDMLEIMVNDDE